MLAFCGAALLDRFRHQPELVCACNTFRFGLGAARIGRVPSRGAEVPGM